MTQWFYKVGDVETGPVAFEDLVRLLREGTLDESVPVRREGSTAWARAWTVPMLAAALERAKSAAEAASHARAAAPQPSEPNAEPHAQRAATARTRATRPANRLDWLVPLVGGAIAVLVAYAAAARAMRFPPSRLKDGETGDYYFVFVGRCEAWECALLYFDVFCVAAAIAWWVWHRIDQR